MQEQSVSPALTTQQDQYFTVKCLRHVWIIIFTIQTSYSIRARVAGTFWRERSSDGNFHLRWKASDNCSRFRDEAEQMHRKHDEGRQNENMSQRQVGEEERKKRGDQTQSVMPHNYSSSFHYSQSDLLCGPTCNKSRNNISHQNGTDRTPPALRTSHLLQLVALRWLCNLIRDVLVPQLQSEDISPERSQTL